LRDDRHPRARGAIAAAAGSFLRAAAPRVNVVDTTVRAMRLSARSLPRSIEACRGNARSPKVSLRVRSLARAPEPNVVADRRGNRSPCRGRRTDDHVELARFGRLLIRGNRRQCVNALPTRGRAPQATAHRQPEIVLAAGKFRRKTSLNLRKSITTRP
jgi:hypothetical protein